MLATFSVTTPPVPPVAGDPARCAPSEAPFWASTAAEMVLPDEVRLAEPYAEFSLFLREFERCYNTGESKMKRTNYERNHSKGRYDRQFGQWNRYYE